MNNGKINILLVDDDDVAAEGVRRSLRRIEFDHTLVWAEDGQAALDILRGQHPELRIERPLLILLDLNMPRMNGFEFLQQMRADPLLRREVVFVLTTSDRDQDRSRAYDEQIAGFMVKSLIGPQFSRLANLLKDYHLSVSLPTEEGHRAHDQDSCHR